MKNFKMNMMRRIFVRYTVLYFLPLLLTGLAGLPSLKAQQALSLDSAISLSWRNNHLLQIRDLQVEENKAKIEESKIKAYPVLNLNSGYTYNYNISTLTIPQGSLGVLPIGDIQLPMPPETISKDLGKHNLFHAGAVAYQPITQQAKIKTGVKLAQTELLVAEQEKNKARQQLMQGVEKLYYGILIDRKKKEAARLNIELTKSKLQDVDNALAAGKTIDVNADGLNADLADKEQELLKLDIEEQNYLADLKQLTGISSANIDILNADSLPTQDMENTASQTAIDAAQEGNTDLQLAALNETKAGLGVAAVKQSNLPDVGAMAGYVYQKGIGIIPNSSPFAGVMLSWNLQTLFSNKQLYKQRSLLLQQAQQNRINTEEKVNNDIEKALRNINQSRALIAVAQKAVNYRKKELKVQLDKKDSGMNVDTDIMQTRYQLAQSESDLLAAQLACRLAVSDLNILVGAGK